MYTLIHYLTLFHTRLAIVKHRIERFLIGLKALIRGLFHLLKRSCPLGVHFKGLQLGTSREAYSF